MWSKFLSKARDIAESFIEVCKSGIEMCESAIDVIDAIVNIKRIFTRITKSA